MVLEVSETLRSGATGKIMRARDDDMAHASETQRHQAAIGKQPDPDGDIDAFLGHVRIAVRQHQSNGERCMPPQQLLR